MRLGEVRFFYLYQSHIKGVSLYIEHFIYIYWGSSIAQLFSAKVAKGKRKVIKSSKFIEVVGSNPRVTKMLFLCLFPWLSGKSIIKKSKVEVPPSKVIQNDNENGEIDSDTKLYVVTSGYRLETGSIVIERGSRWESMGMPSILG